MAKNLVIVESPTKAKTIKRFLGRDFNVQSSFGHIRDLPKSKMGIDIEHDFEPQYVIPPKAKKNVTILKKLAKSAEIIYLATDEDREGEAISWHLVSALGLDIKKTKRIVFHEITKRAIEEAIKNPRELDTNLVSAQQARRVLDRLVGYELSPFLWSKVKRGLSAGRVQSVAVRLICEREAEIEKFKAEEYWSIEADLKKDDATFTARLSKRDDKPIKKLDIHNQEEADQITKALEGAAYTVSTVEKKERKKSPYPPFTTSLLQQAAGQRLGYTAKRTMLVAQQLYEGVDLASEGQTGLITYMRTDSFNLSQEAVAVARDTITKRYGAHYLPEKPHFYKNKSKGAQEAHEAIRPTDPSRHPEDIKDSLTPEQYKLYSLIWRQMIASQMNPAIMDVTTVDITAANFTFRANGNIMKFDGFMRVFIESGMKQEETLLPELTQGNVVDLVELHKDQHFTEPPARFTEAALVKKLEELGIGRPSTYAPIMSTIQDRGYVEKEERKFKPTEIGKLVNSVLTEHFANIVDYAFTAQMEKELDEVAEGEREWVPVIGGFYKPFHENLSKKDKELSKKELTEEATDMKCEKCGRPMVIKMGRFGKFYACSGYPECKNTKPMEEEKVPEEYQGVFCPTCGKPMVVKRGRFGQFLGCSDYPTCKTILPIEKKIGVPCPKCGKGEIIEKRSRRGKIFFACNQYPTCDQSYWQKPTGEKCPESGDLLVFAAKGKVRCSSKECNYTAELPEKEPNEA